MSEEFQEIEGAVLVAFHFDFGFVNDLPHKQVSKLVHDIETHLKGLLKTSDVFKELYVEELKSQEK